MNKRRARVACIGIAVIDHIYHVAHLPTGDGKQRAARHAVSGGGMAAGAAVAVARLGGDATWLGRVGADNDGCTVLRLLEQMGVDVTQARLIAEADTSHSIVLVDEAGNRAIVAYGGTTLPQDASWLELDAIGAHDTVLADLRWEEGALAALRAARAHGRVGVLDADSTRSPNALALVEAASHVIFSEQGIADIFGCGEPTSALERASQHAPFVAVTLGARGVAWIDASKRLRHFAAPAVRAVETLGAGDLFHGAFALALAEGANDTQALEAATYAASLKCTREGGWASFPTRREVDDWRGAR